MGKQCKAMSSFLQYGIGCCLKTPSGGGNSSKYWKCMKHPMQINAAREFGRQPRQQHRYYSVYSTAVACQIFTGSSGVTLILELYEKPSI